jgi:hypothetical protein
MMLTDAQMEAFETEGVVLVDTLSTLGGLTSEQLDDAESTWDRLVLDPGGSKPKEQDEGFIRLISHTFFENVAKQMLRSEQVKLIELGATNRPPTDRPQAAPDAQREHWATGAHIDLQITTADWNATPRRDLLALWLWVTDVSPDRAAMRVLPGSHRPIMRHWDSVLSAERKQSLPRCHGVLPQPGTSYPSYPEHIPRSACMVDGLDYADCEPLPVAVPRGTAQIFTQSMLHTAWHNSTSEPRKGFIISWSAVRRASCLTPSCKPSLLPTMSCPIVTVYVHVFQASVGIGFESGRVEGLRNTFPKLRQSIATMQPGREHIVPTPAEFLHFPSVSTRPVHRFCATPHCACHVVGLCTVDEQDYHPAWPETFIPGKTEEDRGEGWSNGFASPARRQRKRAMAAAATPKL